MCIRDSSRSGSDSTAPISPVMVAILEKSSVKKIAATNGPTIPRDRIAIVIKSGAVRLPFL